MELSVCLSPKKLHYYKTLGHKKQIQSNSNDFSTLLIFYFIHAWFSVMFVHHYFKFLLFSCSVWIKPKVNFRSMIVINNACRGAFIAFIILWQVIFNFSKVILFPFLTWHLYSSVCVWRTHMWACIFDLFLLPLSSGSDPDIYPEPSQPSESIKVTDSCQSQAEEAGKPQGLSATWRYILSWCETYATRGNNRDGDSTPSRLHTALAMTSPCQALKAREKFVEECMTLHTPTHQQQIGRIICFFPVAWLVTSGWGHQNYNLEPFLTTRTPKKVHTVRKLSLNCRYVTTKGVKDLNTSFWLMQEASKELFSHG